MDTLVLYLTKLNTDLVREEDGAVLFYPSGDVSKKFQLDNEPALRTENPGDPTDLVLHSCRSRLLIRVRDECEARMRLSW